MLFNIRGVLYDKELELVRICIDYLACCKKVCYLGEVFRGLGLVYHFRYVLHEHFVRYRTNALYAYGVMTISAICTSVQGLKNPLSYDIINFNV